MGAAMTGRDNSFIKEGLDSMNLIYALKIGINFLQWLGKVLKGWYFCQPK
jgi:hypothetical protein